MGDGKPNRRGRKPIAKPSEKQAAAAKKRQRRRFRAVWRRMVFVAMLVVVALIGGSFIFLNSIELPSVNAADETSFVCLSNVADGQCNGSNSVAQYSATENRVPIAYSQISKVLIQAVVASEDRGYFRHSGIDPLGIARALYQDATHSGGTQGGSTITQQYVKQAYLTSEQSLFRKLREAALSMKLERQLTKQQILERYLNRIYFGRGAYGVEAAAKTYFNVSAKNVTLDQAALLAGLIRSPVLGDPFPAKGGSQEKEARRRRRVTLDAMVAIGSITSAQAAAANAVPMQGNVLPQTANANNTRVTPDFDAVAGRYIAEWVRQQVTTKMGSGAAYTAGLKVYLTVDPAKQRSAYGAISKSLNQPNDPSAALVSIDENGRIVAMVGGENFDEEQTNFALGKAGGGSGRQAGSTFKAFALAAFVAQGNSVDTVYPAPAVLTLPKANQGVDWPVSNYEDVDLGTVTVRDATWHSINTVYAQIMQQVGARAVADMATKMGVTARVPAYNSVVLGTTDVSVLDMATAYSTFANHGTLIQPYILRRIEDSNGKLLYEAPEPTKTPAIPPDVADTVTNVLRGVLTQGTGTAAKIKKEAAGKTGTTSDYKDAWFNGYTCHLTTAVWMGYPQNQQMNAVHPTAANPDGIKVTGGSLPAVIWHDYMSAATANDDKCTYRDINAGATMLNPTLVVGPPTTTTIAPPVTLPVTPDPGAATTVPPPATPAAPVTTTTAAAPPPG